MSQLLAMPDDPAALPQWLDRRLAGPDLLALAAELRVVHRPGDVPELDAILGRDRAALLAGGSGAAPRPLLTRLLQNPDLLVELQALVFAEGGDYWFELPTDPELRERAAAVTDAVMDAIRGEPIRVASRRRWHEYAGVMLATAAAVMLMVNLTAPKPAAAGWGFAKLRESPPGEPPAAVYARLATLAGEWDKKQPADALGVAKRLGEFRQGCAALQLTPDLPLPPAEVAWLKSRCRDWAAALDAHLRDLEATGDAAATREAVGKTVAASSTS